MEEVSGGEGEERRRKDRTGREKRQKEGKKEEKRGKGRRENYSNSFPLAFPPRSQIAAPPIMVYEVAAPWAQLHCWLFLWTVFGFHKGHCSPFGFSGPDVRQDLLVNVPYPSKDRSIIFKQRCLKTPE